MGRGAVTTQVLGEFFTLGPLILDAAIGVRDHKMSFWDAQIWAAARTNGIPVILSEDFSDGSVLDGVRFVNRFLSGFVLEDCSTG